MQCRFVSTWEAARYYGVTPMCIRDRIERGDVFAIKTLTRWRVFLDV